MSVKKINIAFTIDSNYFEHFCVALTSLLENNPNLVNRIFLINDLKDKNKLFLILNFFKKKYSVYIEVLELVDSAKFENFKINDFMSKATYFRLMLPDIIPSDISTILYLDADLVISGEINEIAKLSFELEPSCYAFVVDHRVNPIELSEYSTRLGVKFKKYFNAGVMFLNLDLMRSDKSTTKLLEIAQNKNLLWWDQDVLNVFFLDKWLEMNATYNAFGLNKTLDPIPKIIHFTGSSKPWQPSNKHPYKYLYWKYLKMTPFNQSVSLRYLVIGFEELLGRSKHIVKLCMRKIIRR